MSSKAGTTDYPIGRNVPFPFPNPYRQQVDFMDSLLLSLKDKTKVILLESPTGTGKSLSLACSSVAWLRFQEQEDLAQTSTTDNNTHVTIASDTDDWLTNWVNPEDLELQQQESALRERALSSRGSLQRELETLRSKFRDKNNNLERRENLVRSSVTAAKMLERQGYRANKKSRAKIQPVDDFCVADYHSDQEEQEHSNDMQQETMHAAATSASSLLHGAALDGSSVIYGKSAIGSVQPGSGYRKIIYAARTHSQLSQFVNELRRTTFTDVRVVALGGRQVLCGNTSVNRPGISEQTINDACLDLKKDTTSSCPLLSSLEGLATLALHMLAQPTDIEDAAALGKASHSCAYYASRKSLTAAEIVVMPYSMLLSKPSREAVGLNLKQCLVLVDEAHNLPEAIRSLHSCRLTLSVACAALDQLIAYTKRYADRLAGRNLYYLGQLRKCIDAFTKHLQQEPHHMSRMISAAELLINLKLDNINLFKIISYIKQSRLSQKMLGFANSQTKATTEVVNVSKHVSALSIVANFLSKLTSSSREGKVVTCWPKLDNISRSVSSYQEPTMRFVALHPAIYFQEIVEEARAVVLVGGTLRPFNHLAAELLDRSYLADASKADESARRESTKDSTTYSSAKLTTFTCSHVIPDSHVLLQCLSKGPSNITLDFRHQSRGNDCIMDELGTAIIQLTMLVPAGMVVFLPSYSYEAQLVKRWKESGVWNQLNRQKRVHREPKQSSQVEATLETYSKDANAFGALLLSVVGGKMSEGINFADDMARCVMVVGLPYPDLTDPELKEKMAIMDQTPGGISGEAYYHNLCMRAVNQSIGRAIRHANDYAAIILADQRYSSDPRIWHALPAWLKKGKSRQGCHSFQLSNQELKDFFASRKNAVCPR